MLNMIIFNELTEMYNTRNYGCGTGYLGRVYCKARKGLKPTKVYLNGKEIKGKEILDYGGLFFTSDGKVYYFNKDNYTTELMEHNYPEEIKNIKCNKG